MTGQQAMRRAVCEIKCEQSFGITANAQRDLVVGALAREKIKQGRGGLLLRFEPPHGLAPLFI